GAAGPGYFRSNGSRVFSPALISARRVDLSRVAYRPPSKSGASGLMPIIACCSVGFLVGSGQTTVTKYLPVRAPGLSPVTRVNVPSAPVVAVAGMLFISPPSGWKTRTAPGAGAPLTDTFPRTGCKATSAEQDATARV